LQIVQTMLSNAANLSLLTELWTHCDVDTLYIIMRAMTLHTPSKSTVKALLSISLPKGPYEALGALQLRDMSSPRMLSAPPMATIHRETLWAHLCLRCLVLFYEQICASLLSDLQINMEDLTHPIDLLEAVVQLNQQSQNIIMLHGELIDATKLLAEEFWHSWEQDATILQQTSHEEYYDVLTLTRFVFMRTDMQPPLAFFLQIIAGKTPITLSSLRVETLSLLRKLPIDVLVLQSSQCTDPNLMLYLCLALKDRAFSVYDRTTLLMMMSHLEFILDINFHLDEEEPFMYEQTLHVMLSVGQSDTNVSAAMRNLTLLLACKLLHRLSLTYPRRNFIESVYHAFNQAMTQAKLNSTQQSAMRQSLHAALVTPGHREVMMELVNLDEDTSPWLGVFPRAFVTLDGNATNNATNNTHKTNVDNMDSITCVRQRRLFKFAPLDTEGVGLETIIHHFAMNGMTNPFTNTPCSWTLLASANNNWSLQP